MAGARGWGRRPSGIARINRGSRQSTALAIWRPARETIDAANGSSISLAAATSQVVSELGGLCVLQSAGTSRDTETYTISSTHSLTVAAWVNTLGLTQNPYAGIMGSRSDSLVGLQLTSSRKLTMSWNNTPGEYDAASALTLPSSGWCLVVGVHDATVSTVYCYGEGSFASFQLTGLTDNARSPSAWNFGVDSADTARYWNGKYADVRVWNRAFSPAEVWSLYDPRSRWDLYWVPSTRVYGFVGAAASFKSAWARGSNVILQPGVIR